MDPLRVIDIGANVGDSALQMLRANDCRILCVEGDDHWVKWLRRNTVSDARITIEPSLVTSGKIPYLAPVRARGTTQFKPAAVAGARTVTPRELRNRHAAFVDVDLIKIDTDGYDCVLVPALASVWIASSPALFFEFDPDMTLSLGQVDPWRVFGELSTLGYVSGIVWDNFGGLIGSGSLTQCAQLCAPLREARERREFDYVDIAVAGAEKGAVLQAMM
jgi:FkbM family methyltransferase